MTNRDVSAWLAKSPSSSDLQLYVCGIPFNLNSERLASKSAKVSALLKENPHEGLSYFFRDIPSNAETFELVGRFCHGYELQMSTENVIPLACVAHYLGMTESHSSDNLLKKALTFFGQEVLNNWNETIKALRGAENIIFQQALHIGLIDACCESIIAMAQVDPHLLGAPVRPNARRRLFDLDWQSEDLATLSLTLYQPIVHSMKQRGVPSEFLAASICQYAKRWIFPSTHHENGNMSVYERKAVREVIEAVEKLLPNDRGLLPCTFLFEMIRYAIAFEASSDGFEMRIGKQLEEATVKDLLIPSQGYAKEELYDIECLRRILKNYYSNYSSSQISGLFTVAELVEEFLAEVASDIDLKMGTFLSIADMSISASLGTQRNSDGLYRAIDIYLDKHRYLSEVEKEEVCRVLDVHQMSPEACDHASKNERLPLRVVVQVLFVAQLQLRDTITKEEDEAMVSCGEEQVMNEIESMNNKVIELEREYHMMRKEIEHSCSLKRGGKISLWREMKRKFGCITTIHDCNCHQVKKKKKKKVHPRYAK
ncbi:hypothetical protein LWI28_026466 [Acer negundo]|uniref:NPH3 domain-containing protein n=1 Tax=Acer negundo TaxID=4023 RepID=A0AAD5J720_ACENE|nr:hypothetical protein LWI28_026466 [Acer negundo]KAK4851436.1 hypothetical protein QYF36_015165 [Acer negundo]